MPEKGEVAIFTRDLKNKFPPGTKIARVKICDPNPKFALKIPKEDFPLTIKKVRSKGKKTYVYLTNGMGFLVSYGMGGAWKVKKTELTKYCFVREDGYRYYWQTVRGLHCEFVKYLPQNIIRNELNELGVDVYLSNPTKEEILACYLTKRGQMRRCKLYGFLLDQSAFCGIGNYLAARIMYLLHISPHRRVCDLTKKEKLAIFSTAKEIVTEVVNMGGHTIFDWMRDDERPLASYDVTPYGMQGKDDKGHKIKAEAVGNRTVYWVPATQK